MSGFAISGFHRIPCFPVGEDRREPFLLQIRSRYEIQFETDSLRNRDTPVPLRKREGDAPARGGVDRSVHLPVESWTISDHCRKKRTIEVAVLVFDLEEVIAAVVTPVPTAGRGAFPPYGVSEADTEADPRAKHAEGTLPRHCGSQPNRRQQSPPAIAFPRPDQGRPHFRRLAPA